MWDLIVDKHSVIGACEGEVGKGFIMGPIYVYWQYEVR